MAADLDWVSPGARTGGTAQQGEQTAQIVASEAAAVQDIQAAILVARRWPRNTDQAFQNLIAACKRPTFARRASYSFPRGDSVVTGPSVHLARQAAQCYGNIRWGCEIVRDEPGQRFLRAWAWDVETNVRVSTDATFRKLVQRKQQGATRWVEPNERDLLELTNNHAAKAVRNCLLQILPYDLIEDGLTTAKNVAADQARKDPDQARKRVVAAFGSIGVPVEEIEEHLGYSLGQATPEDLAKLQAVVQSIREGDSRWSEYHQPKQSKQDQERPSKSGGNQAPRPPANPQPEPTAEPEVPREVDPPATETAQKPANPARDPEPSGAGDRRGESILGGDDEQDARAPITQRLIDEIKAAGRGLHGNTKNALIRVYGRNAAGNTKSVGELTIGEGRDLLARINERVDAEIRGTTPTA